MISKYFTLDCCHHIFGYKLLNQKTNLGAFVKKLLMATLFILPFMTISAMEMAYTCKGEVRADDFILAVSTSAPVSFY
jgi:hypothetical protein